MLFFFSYNVEQWCVFYLPPEPQSTWCWMFTASRCTGWEGPTQRRPTFKYTPILSVRVVACAVWLHAAKKLELHLFSSQKINTVFLSLVSVHRAKRKKRLELCFSDLVFWFTRNSVNAGLGSNVDKFLLTDGLLSTEEWEYTEVMEAVCDNTVRVPLERANPNQYMNMNSCLGARLNADFVNADGHWIRLPIAYIDACANS